AVLRAAGGQPDHDLDVLVGLPCIGLRVNEARAAEHRGGERALDVARQKIARIHARHCASNSSAPVANAYMLATRSLLPVSMVAARSLPPTTAMHARPAGLP